MSNSKYVSDLSNDHDVETFIQAIKLRNPHLSTFQLILLQSHRQFLRIVNDRNKQLEIDLVRLHVLLHSIPHVDMFELL